MGIQDAKHDVSAYPCALIYIYIYICIYVCVYVYYML